MFFYLRDVKSALSLTTLWSELFFLCKNTQVLSLGQLCYLRRQTRYQIFHTNPQVQDSISPSDLEVHFYSLLLHVFTI